MIFALSAKLCSYRTEGFVSPEPGPRKLILKIFEEYFVVCPVELNRINNMLSCHILSPQWTMVIMQ